MRFEVGYGLEGDITDAFTTHVLNERIAPLFREQRYADGLAAAIEAVADKLKVDLGAQPVETTNPTGMHSPGRILFLLLLFFLFFFLDEHGPAKLLGRGLGGGGWGGGGFGGGGSAVAVSAEAAAGVAEADLRAAEASSGGW